MQPDLPCLGATTADDLLDGRLVPARAAAAEAHVADCGDCRRLLAALARSAAANGAEAEASVPTPRRGDAVGRYWIEGVLGEGGMGVVYLASDPELGRRVAVKLLRSADAGGRARLLREARAVAQLSHPHVIQVYEVGVWREQVFLAMEYVEGATLRAHLAGARPPWGEIVTLFLAAGRALAAAHAAGVVHRDFKPDNVLVGHDGRVRVSDFGLARLVLDRDAGAPVTSEATAAPADASLTRTGAVLGTPRYMAPEQRAGRIASPRADQYSFCLVLAEALTGVRAPRRLWRVLERGLRETPLERHASMDALLGALERAAGLRPRAGVPTAVALVALAGMLACALGWRDARREAATAHAVAERQREAFALERSIHAGLQARSSAPPAPRPPPPFAPAPLEIAGSRPAGPPAPPAPTIAPELVLATVRAHRGELRACYDRARRSAPSLEGTAVAAFVVDASGGVRDVGVSGLGHLGAESCLAQVFGALRFPATPGGQPLAARYPIRFVLPR